MYSVVSLIGMFVREYYLPNPFINFFADANVASGFNLLIGGSIIGILSYGITHIYYEKGSIPFLGSISYTVWFAINTFIFIGVSKIASNITVMVWILAIVYLVIIIGVGYTTNKLKGYIF